MCCNQRDSDATVNITGWKAFKEATHNFRRLMHVFYTEKLIGKLYIDKKFFEKKKEKKKEQKHRI